MASNTRTRHGRGSRATGSDLVEGYFRWLKDKVQEDGHRRNGYWDLFHILFNTEFLWFVENDMNRIADGKALRREYFHELGRRGNMDIPCSVLEVLVALSRRLAWLASGSAEGWAWQLLCNLDLHHYRDPLSKRKAQEVNDILYALIWRDYYPDGVGGFFPLTRPKEDQTKIEIWYQMHAYVGEIHPEY